MINYKAFQLKSDYSQAGEFSIPTKLVEVKDTPSTLGGNINWG
jgi:hypothetical protein